MRRSMFVLCFSVLSLLGEGLSIKFEKFSPEAENYWRTFFETLEQVSSKDYPPYSPRPVVFTKGPETGWSGSIGGGATFDLPLVSLDRRAFGNGPAHRVAAHEFGHLLQMTEVPGGYMLFVPNTWAEASAEIFASKAEAMMAGWVFEKKLGADLALRYAMKGGVAFQGPGAYHLMAYPLLEMEGVLGSQFFPALHEIFRMLSKRAAKAGPPYRLIRQDQILDELDRAFPGVLVHGLPLRVYLSVQPAFAKPLGGEQFFVSAWDSWYEGNAYIGTGPVNPQIVDFLAWKSEVVFEADDPSQYQLNSTTLTKGKFRVEMRGIADDKLYWSTSVDLSATPGGQRFTFTNPLSLPEGRYRLVAKDEKGIVVAESIFAATAGNPLLINPVREGWMYWEQNPVLKLSESRVAFSSTRRSTIVQVVNLNPAAGSWVLENKPERIGLAIWNFDIQDMSWFRVSLVSQNLVLLEVLPGITTRKKGVACFQSSRGVSTVCVEAENLPTPPRSR